ncbi:hypothetical protein [Geodermatophilus sp. SYSU D00766]
MPVVDEHSYRFRLADHWRAGVRRGLELRGDRLVVPDELTVHPLRGAARADAAALPTVDACGQLLWLRPRSRQLMRLLPRHHAASELGHISGPVPARRLVAGGTLLWVLADGGLDRYGAASLQRLTPPWPRSGWRLSDVIGDGGDGVWVTEASASRRWRLRHLDCWGRTCGEPVPIDGPDGDELSVIRVEGSGLVVMDPATSTTLFIVDPAPGSDRYPAGAPRPVRSVPVDPLHGGGRTLLAAGPGERVHLLTVPDGVPGRGQATYRAIDLASGDVEQHQSLNVPRVLGRPTSLLASAPHLVLACARGLATIAPTQTAREPSGATFITPGLVSPAGPRAGWNRADVDALLPAGTTMELSWAATDDAWLADRAAQLLAGPSTPARVEQLESLLEWHGEGVTYRGDRDQEERLAALLHQVEESTLWLRVRLHVAAGGTAAELRGLAVRYPDRSYLDDLPAIYRENPRAAEDLAQILGPYEVLLDGIDETLERLPTRSDPGTADDDWTDYLLGWLGFPPLAELSAPVRRSVLERAAELLDLRGTQEGLERLLHLVTGRPAGVTDSSQQPAGWFLGGDDVPVVGAEPTRLGVDTVVLRRLPRPARAGALVLGDARLGDACADLPSMLAQRARTVTVTLDVDLGGRQALEPVVERLLDAFVPAHCRVRLVWSGRSGDRTRRLDVDLRLAPEAGAGEVVHADSRLHGDADWRLGVTTRIGNWSLPDPGLHAAVLDHRARLGTGSRLQ